MADETKAEQTETAILTTADTEHWLGSAESECDCVYGQELCQKRNALNLQRESEPTLYYIQKGLYLYNVISLLI